MNFSFKRKAKKIATANLMGQGVSPSAFNEVYGAQSNIDPIARSKSLVVSISMNSLWGQPALNIPNGAQTR